MKNIKIFLIFMIQIYKIYISPFLPASCRFHPTCSEYAIVAIEKFGIIKGLKLSIKRILKCHPFNAGGYDPVSNDV